MTGLQFLYACRKAVKDETALVVDSDILTLGFAKLVLALYEGMPELDRKEFFAQDATMIIAAIRLSLSGYA